MQRSSFPVLRRCGILSCGRRGYRGMKLKKRHVCGNIPILLAGSLLVAILFANGGAEEGLIKKEACTSFRLLLDRGPIVGKNLDWSIADGILSLNPRGLQKRALVEGPCLALEWASVYASISFNQFGREFPLGGINEAGLVVEELSYWPSEYPPLEDLPTVNELQWIQYQLDVHSSVSEVIEHISEVQILPLLFGLHYFVVDASGDAAVIEFLDGELTVRHGSELPVPVLTNDTYRNSMRHLKAHEGFGGKRVVGNGPESPERFVRAATMVQDFEREQQVAIPVRYAFQILNAVGQDDTQWSIVYDVESRAVHFMTANVRVVRRVSLANLDLDCGESGLSLDLGEPRAGDVGENLSPWTSLDQDRLISGVLEKIEREGALGDRKQQWLRDGVVKFGSTDPHCEGE